MRTLSDAQVNYAILMMLLACFASFMCGWNSRKNYEDWKKEQPK